MFTGSITAALMDCELMEIKLISISAIRVIKNTQGIIEIKSILYGNS